MGNCYSIKLKTSASAPLPKLHHVQIKVTNNLEPTVARNSFQLKFSVGGTISITNGYFVDSDLASNPVTSKTLTNAKTTVYFITNGEDAYIDIPYAGLTYIGVNGDNSSNIPHNYKVDLTAFKYCNNFCNFQLSGDEDIKGDLSEMWDSTSLRGFAITKTSVTGNLNRLYEHLIANGFTGSPNINNYGGGNLLLNTKVVVNGSTWAERSKYDIIDATSTYYRCKVITSSVVVSDWEYNLIDGVWVGTNLLSQ